MYLRGLKNKTAVAHSTIPLENAQGDILLISGEKDTLWPLTIMCDNVVKRLDEHSYRFQYRHISLQTDHNPTVDPQFWPTVLGFFRQ
jgi:hypothetical protein